MDQILGYLNELKESIKEAQADLDESITSLKARRFFSLIGAFGAIVIIDRLKKGIKSGSLNRPRRRLYIGVNDEVRLPRKRKKAFVNKYGREAYYSFISGHKWRKSALANFEYTHNKKKVDYEL